MKILYVHGFGSQYDPQHAKIQMLETLGTVVGVDIDYCKGFQSAFDTLMETIRSEKVDLVVGTSMGGYMAAHTGSAAGIPFVSLNPAVEPNQTLQKWEGTFTDFTGQDKCLTRSVIEDYPDIVTEGFGLVVVESGDEVIDANHTMSLLEDVFQVEMIKGGSHRFTHLDRARDLIQRHIRNANTSYEI